MAYRSTYRPPARSRLSVQALLGALAIVGAAAAAAGYLELAGWRGLYGAPLALADVWGRAFLADAARTAAVALALGATVPATAHAVPSGRNRFGQRLLALWALGTALVLLALGLPTFLA